MDEYETKKLYKEAIEKWSIDFQLDMVCEECAELIKAILKYRRGKIHYSEIIKEGVDVEIMIEQLKEILDYPMDWKRFRRLKINRLKGMLEDVE